MAKVKVYTKYGCPQCDMTKNVLNAKGIDYELYNVQDDEEAKRFVVEELGVMAMPVVIIAGQEPFTGFRPDKLEQL